MKGELFKTRGYKISQEEIDALIKRTKMRLKSAKVLIENESYSDSVSRSYYAILDISRALLLSAGYFAKTHAGVLTLLSLRFIKTGKIPLKYKNIFKRAKEWREHADYSALTKFNKKQAEEIYKQAREFVKMAQKEIAANRSVKTLKAVLL